MEVKKSPKADLEGKKTTWLLVGFVLILAAMFVAFEWTERDKQGSAGSPRHTKGYRHAGYTIYGY